MVREGEERRREADSLTAVGFIDCLTERKKKDKLENKRHPMRKGAKSQKEWLSTHECMEHVLLMLIYVRSSRSGA